VSQLSSCENNIVVNAIGSPNAVILVSASLFA
jgi:hypothetical protein